eukprot:CAMPEP_0113301168 /NCGR_PEP_ID=MMETSP0010_2-20120614/2508_1 /TAXON_ID=216773 ORGANISM="Corethron hystrix, Strain 308" /NCGR_SAMPLE_ID=MMETSP0010_2 /ASSEMBLY_ACC=CAM_ASM_000155 /LENGTH=944 /DNA_ID=CAMNT_0000154743 /DNA_START=249 /DNA_END=3083 /DNA_ORIENTATION=+ /assembly_acc=CAM_ASM_000155
MKTEAGEAKIQKMERYFRMNDRPLCTTTLRLNSVSCDQSDVGGNLSLGTSCTDGTGPTASSSVILNKYDGGGKTIRGELSEDRDADDKADLTADGERKLGTVNGVFLPCLQNILGVILFIRLPFITGQAGCFLASLMLVICFTATFTTSLSLSALVTNGSIQAGGPYYIISRNLGVEIGGALGALFYLGTTVAASMYVLGAVEAFQEGFGVKNLFRHDVQVISLVIMSQLAVVVGVGPRFVAITAPIFLSVVVISILCIIVGLLLFALDLWTGKLMFLHQNMYDENFAPNYTPDLETGRTPTFFSLLGLLFPSFTGIMAGSNRSAVLKNSSESIPTGTISAIFATTGLYFLFVSLLSSTLSNDILLENKLVVADIAFPHPIIVKAGIIMSSLGAALQCLTGASRLLAAIAEDGCLPFLRAFTPETPSANPVKAIIVTWLIASLFTIAGNIDFITPIITMFFLMMYCGINFCCFLMGFLKAPGFRPTFKYFHYKPSFFGFCWCLGLAIMINWFTVALSFLFLGMLSVYVAANGARKQWGDVGQGVLFSLGKFAVSSLSDKGDMHPKNWRPQVLSVIDTDEHGYPIKPHMLRLTAQMKKGYGVTMVLGRIIGSTLDKLAVERAGITRKILTQFMREEESHCYVDVSVSHGCMSEYIWAAALHSGLGPLRPNSILLAWPEDWKMEYNKSEQYFETLRGIINLEKTLLIFKGNDTYPGSLEKLTWATIDVWWIVYDGGLLLLLPYILSKNRVWRYGTRLRLFAVITNPSIVASEVTSAITKHLRKVRISATVTAVDFTTTSIVNDMRINRSSNVEVISNYYKSKSSRHKKSPSFSNHRTVEEVFVDLLPENLPEMKNIPKVFSETSQATDVSTNITERSEPRLETAAYFNRMVKIFSNEARLVVTNMPLIDDSTDSIEFFSYVEAMSDGIDNMLLVRGAGEEVITTYG